MIKKNAVDQFMAARAVGTPLISITCADPEVMITKLLAALIAKEPDVGVVQYDCVRGWKSRTDEGGRAIDTVLTGDGREYEQKVTKNPVVMMELAEHFPANTVLFVLNAHHRTHPMETGHFWQALWNLRDSYKSNYRTIVLVSPDIKVPIEVAQDMFCIEEYLPNKEELVQIVEEVVELVPKFKYSDKNKRDAANAAQGLSPFAAEQAVALALRPKSIDVQEIYERKRALLNGIPGLKIYEGMETFKDIGGCDALKQMLTRIINGRNPPGVIVFLDEVEKTTAGANHSTGDNTGISQDQQGTLLTFMEDNECDGTILVGPTGTAKSALAKAMGNEAGVPTVFLDLGGIKNSLVGASENRFRYALKVIYALSQGHVFFIATSNNISKIPPEFKRRFASGTWMLDLPTEEEQLLIWDIHTAKFNIDKKEVTKFAHPEWSGAEIRNCCRIAYRQQITLAEASKYIVPVAHSAKDTIRQLRKMANGNFLSANTPGLYQYAPKEEIKEIKKK